MARKKSSSGPRVALPLPHRSWGLDQPLFLIQRPRADGDEDADRRRTVTLEELWARVDAKP